jgi:hypothetical protein
MQKAKLIVLTIGIGLLLVAAVYLPGTQPGEGRPLEDPGNCGCHRGYDPLVEPMYTWRGSMMAMATRDPIFFAALDLANFDGAAIGIETGTFCLRCHSPAGHQSGTNALDPTGGSYTGTELEGIFCDFCHAMVDPLSAEGQALQTGSTLVTSYGNAMWVITDTQEKRGPYSDAEARHVWQYDSFQRSGEVCASCHDVSNPLLCDPADPYNVQKCFTEQRTYSEWANSWYADQGEMGSCQFCHMPYMTGKACKQGAIRDYANFGTDPNQFVAVHHLNGGNTFVPDAIAVLFAGDNSIDFDALADGKQRAADLLQTAAALEAFDATDLGTGRIDVRVTNLTGHKLPTGYPEGRRMWINVIGYNSLMQPIWESGGYDPATGWHSYDAQSKIYEVHFGVEQPDGSCQFSFRLVQNNCIEIDNRIPPKGFTNAAFNAVGAGHVHYYYPDGQFWDDTSYSMPSEVVQADVNLYYQTTTREYIEFLATAEGSGTRGADLLATYNATGKAPPVLMETASIVIDADLDGMGDAWELAYGLDPVNPADAAGDLDGDGLTNLEEYLYGSLPNNTESDGDGISDGDEVNVYLTDPSDPDTDADGVDDGDEINVYGTNPLLWDTDGGGESDGSEIAGGRNPLDPSDDGEYAVYNPVDTAPECPSGKSPCIVPEDLIIGRDNIHYGHEPNQPNTIYSSTCADGNTGDFHYDESLDHFMITDLAGATFVAGDPVRLDAGVWCWTDVGFDQLHVFWADSVSDPVWVYAGSTACPAINQNVLSVEFNLPTTSGRIAVRAAFGYEDTGAPAEFCDPLPWSDRDDVIITVAAAAAPGDSDGDGLSDAWENAYACMQANTVDNLADHDGDGLDNQSEYGNSVDPCNWDTDGDFLPDGYEVSNSVGHTLNLDPLDPSDGDSCFEPAGFEDINPNYHEYWNNTDPWSTDPVPPDPRDPACFYWGDADGDGFVANNDKLILGNAIIGLFTDYSVVIPDNGDSQDLDADNVIAGGDMIILQNFIINAPVGLVISRAVALEKVYEPAAAVEVGTTTHVTVKVKADDTAINLYQGGFAVVFEIDPSSTGTAVLLGGEGDELTGRYDVSGPSDPVDGGFATMHLKITGPGPIQVNAAIPACGTNGVGRWCDQVVLSPAFSLTGVIP